MDNVFSFLIKIRFRHLKVLKEDFEEFMEYFNNSYEANDFYIREIVSVFVYISDELSLKSHFENLPVIVNEIWEKMGESGKKIHKSILWAIEKVKISFFSFLIIIIILVKDNTYVHSILPYSLFRLKRITKKP